MRRLKVGIYDYYLDSYGGGEKDVCSMASSLSGDYDVDILSFKNAPRHELEKRLNVDLAGVDVKVVLPFTGYGLISRGMRYIGSRLAWRRMTSGYDLFVNLVNYAPPPSHAKRSVLRIQFPFDSVRDRAAIDTYGMFVANSRFTKYWTKKRWGVDAFVINPPVERFAAGTKRKVVMSVGRFFAGSHNKKHHAMIAAFKKAFDSGMRDWEYHLFGALLPGRENADYLDSVIEAARGYPVSVHADAPFSMLGEFYAKAAVFVHATGLDEDEQNCPEKYEHFGITTVEAMSAGCVPVVMDGGGQGEIVSHGKDGFLFSTQAGLYDRLLQVMKDERLRKELSAAAAETCERYGMKRYRGEVLDMADRATRGL